MCNSIKKNKKNNGAAFVPESETSFGKAGKFLPDNNKGGTVEDI
jgi:hypothetical protein